MICAPNERSSVYQSRLKTFHSRDLKHQIRDAFKLDDDLHIPPLAFQAKPLGLRCGLEIMRFMRVGDPYRVIFPKQSVFLVLNHNFHGWKRKTTSHFSQLRRELLAIFRGRLADNLFENAVEMSQRLETNFKRHFTYAEIRIE